MKRAVFALAIAAMAVFAGLPANAQVSQYHFSIINEYGSNIDVSVTSGSEDFRWTVPKDQTGKRSISSTPGAGLIKVTCRVKSDRKTLDLDPAKRNISVDVDDNCRLQIEYH